MGKIMTDNPCFLVPIDGSGHSQKTLQRAVRMAKEQSAELIVVQVLEPTIYNETSDLFRDLHLPSEDERAAEGFAHIESCITEEGITWRRIVAQGVPADKIIEIADEHQVDMIIIGRRGHSALRRFLLGSVTDRVVQHAHCDVLVVD